MPTIRPKDGVDVLTLFEADKRMIVNAHALLRWIERHSESHGHLAGITRTAIRDLGNVAKELGVMVNNPEPNP